MENIFEYLDPPEQVAARLREKHRLGAKVAFRELGNLKKAEVENRNALDDIRQRYPQGVSVNVRLQFDAVAGGGNCLAIVEETLLLWDRLSAADVCHVMGTWPVDVNRVTVLDNNLSYGFGLANRAKIIREDIKKLYEALEFDEAEEKRLGPGDGLWSVPAWPTAREIPVQVVTDFKTLK